MTGRLIRWLAAALLLASTPAHAAPLDAKVLKSIALSDLVQLSTDRYRLVALADGNLRDDGLKDIAALDPKVQTLVWLKILDNGRLRPRPMISRPPHSSASAI